MLNEIKRNVSSILDLLASWSAAVRGARRFPGWTSGASLVALLARLG
jgi:hypothetical protein